MEYSRPGDILLRGGDVLIYQEPEAPFMTILRASADEASNPSSAAGGDQVATQIADASRPSILCEAWIFRHDTGTKYQN